MKSKTKTLNYFRVFYDIAKEINSSLDTNQVLNTIVETTTKAMRAKGCSIMLLTSDRKQLNHVAAYGLSNWYIRKGPIKADPAILGPLQGNPLLVLDIATDPRVQYREQAVKEGIASVLSVPIYLRDEIIGILRLYTSETRQFSPEEIDFLGTIANLGAIALEKAEAHQTLVKDFEQCLIDVERSKRELVRLEESKNQLMRFLSIVAHDLKSPLAAVQSYFNVLLGGFAGELNEKQRQMLQRSEQRIKGLLELISDLLDISRIEMGQIFQEMKETSLKETIEPPIEDARIAAEQKNINIVLDIPQELPVVRASCNRLQQMLTNLLSNAIRFTPQGGTIIFRIKCRNHEVEGQISDTGIGIPPNDLPRVFEEFFRGSNVEVPGTGLGLAIVKRIAEAHGGKVWAESPCPGTNAGSKFTFVLPIIVEKPK